MINNVFSLVIKCIMFENRLNHPMLEACGLKMKEHNSTIIKIQFGDDDS